MSAYIHQVEVALYSEYNGSLVQIPHCPTFNLKKKKNSPFKIVHFLAVLPTGAPE